MPEIEIVADDRGVWAMQDFQVAGRVAAQEPVGWGHYTETACVGGEWKIFLVLTRLRRTSRWRSRLVYASGRRNRRRQLLAFDPSFGRPRRAAPPTCEGIGGKPLLLLHVPGDEAHLVAQHRTARRGLRGDRADLRGRRQRPVGRRRVTSPSRDVHALVHDVLGHERCLVAGEEWPASSACTASATW
jgi:hypothetical protein